MDPKDGRWTVTKNGTVIAWTRGDYELYVKVNTTYVDDGTLYDPSTGIQVSGANYGMLNGKWILNDGLYLRTETDEVSVETWDTFELSSLDSFRNADTIYMSPISYTSG